jgi:1-acyl-sn-glycerol-3-phosphate acyltransferase
MPGAGRIARMPSVEEPAARTCHARPGGRACGRRPVMGLPYCREHLGPLKATSWGDLVRGWGATASRAVRSRTGGAKHPEGFDRDLVDALLPIALPLYRWYWRVEVDGVENIPTEGPALLASNHSGTFPVDGAMLKVAILVEHGRNPWFLAGDTVFKVPGLRELTTAAGNARADRESTLELLRRGEVVGVFPEGEKGIGKGWKQRYRLLRFGRGGFVETAMLSGAPIIPTAVVGAEEVFPMVGNLGFVARRFGLPYVPVVLNPLPLPSKWIIQFGEPIATAHYGPEGVEDRQLVLELSELVRQTVQSMLLDGLSRRRTPFF